MTVPNNSCCVDRVLAAGVKTIYQMLLWAIVWSINNRDMISAGIAN